MVSAKSLKAEENINHLNTSQNHTKIFVILNRIVNIQLIHFTNGQMSFQKEIGKSKNTSIFSF